jgi:predicted patatin/cPLA2 family phospholipase
MEDKICEIRSKQVSDQLKNHEGRIEALEKTYSIMEKMDLRMDNVEKTIEKIDNKISAKVEEKGKKWDKLVDYLFYFVLAALLGYIAYELGLKG